jgi:uncharacterized protein YbjQ (UPF0145 family)
MRISNSEKVAGRVNRETLGSIRATEFATTTDMASGIAAAKAKAIAMAEAMGADAIVNLQLEITETSNGLFSATASGQAVITVARRSSMTEYFAEAGLDDVGLKPYMMGNAKNGMSNFIH